MSQGCVQQNRKHNGLGEAVQMPSVVQQRCTTSEASGCMSSTYVSLSRTATMHFQLQYTEGYDMGLKCLWQLNYHLLGPSA